MEETAELFLSVKQFSQLTGISPATVWRYIRAGKLPHLQLGGARSRVLIPASALERIKAFENSVVASGSLAAPASTGRNDSARLSGPRPKWSRHAKKNQE